MTLALVTGGAGFIGSRLGEKLLASGAAVRAVDRLSDYYDPALKRRNVAKLLERDRFELITDDINSLDPHALLDGVDVVYHLAGQPGVRSSWGDEFEVYLRDNVSATQRLLEAAKLAPLKRFVYASSSSIYGDAQHFPTREADTPHPVSPYGVTKLAAEHLCGLYHHGFGVPTVSVRYFTIFGPGQRPDMAFNRFIAAALDRRPLEVFGDGNQSRDFTYVDDAVDATLAAGTAGEPGRVYNIAGGNHATVLEAIAIIGRLTGGALEVEHRARVTGDAARTGADTTLARNELGWVPTVSLDEGITRQFEAQVELRATNV